ncbi:hypothetical protein [Halopiger djelfimassiliensis]|uniref:hypothetical protein n=1 Tax=Halopiger djelfimassiliensis TaxID=1293047 RepID=UPI000677923F|nr:hypothetical protein [Halopiger djelfimassiliensis]
MRKRSIKSNDIGGRDDPEEPSGRLEGVGVAIVVSCFGVTAGPMGVLAGLITAVIWYTLGVAYTLAGGHLLLVVLFSDGIDATTFVVLEAGFVALLVATIVGSRADRRTGLVGIGAVFGTGGITWVSLSRSLVVGAGTAVLTVMIASYLLHRYELVSFDLVSDPERPTDNETDSSYECE